MTQKELTCCQKWSPGGLQGTHVLGTCQNCNACMISSRCRIKSSRGSTSPAAKGRRKHGLQADLVSLTPLIRMIGLPAVAQSIQKGRLLPRIHQRFSGRNAGKAAAGHQHKCSYF